MSQYDAIQSSKMRAAVKSPLWELNNFLFKLRIGMKVWHGWPGFRHGFHYYAPDSEPSPSFMGPLYMDMTYHFEESPAFIGPEDDHFEVDQATGRAVVGSVFVGGISSHDIPFPTPVEDWPIGTAFPGSVFGPGGDPSDPGVSPGDTDWTTTSVAEGITYFSEWKLSNPYMCLQALATAKQFAKSIDPAWNHISVATADEINSGQPSIPSVQIAQRNPANTFRAGWSVPGIFADDPPWNGRIVHNEAPTSVLRGVLNDDGTGAFEVPGAYMVAAAIRPVFLGGTTWQPTPNGIGISADHVGVLWAGGSIAGLSQYAEVVYGRDTSGIFHKISAVDKNAHGAVQSWEPMSPNATYGQTWTVVFKRRSAANIPNPYDFVDDSFWLR